MGLTRASGYVAVGDEAIEYINFTNEQTMVIPQFEDASLIDQLEEDDFPAWRGRGRRRSDVTSRSTWDSPMEPITPKCRR